MTGPSLREAILVAARGLLDTAAEHDPALARATITAIGWGTVELDRAERELGEALGDAFRSAADAPRWRSATRDAALGAATRVGPSIEGGPSLVLLEPDTEGRLAAILARHGEGVSAVYVRTSNGVDLLVVPAAVGPTSAPGGRPPTALAGRPPSALG